MPELSVTLPAWAYPGTLDDAPAWLRGHGHVDSFGRSTEMLAIGRPAVQGERVLRLADGQVVGVGDVVVRGLAGLRVFAGPEFARRFGAGS